MTIKRAIIIKLLKLRVKNSKGRTICEQIVDVKTEITASQSKKAEITKEESLREVKILRKIIRRKKISMSLMSGGLF